ncbi:MAG: hypothetical protein JXB88_09030 [Spirochaetales bacterium]|nr:hypothetical protein [Spirochaetales bacterium]
MGITLIIVGGVVLVTLFASGFDYLTKKRQRLDQETKNKVTELEKKVAELESMITERNDRVLQLEDNVSFVTKLLEEKK